jgi:CDP-diacylglycerol--serine O-phosphatidyltransferase
VTENALAEHGAPEVKRRPKAAYALPTLFTAGNIFLGYLSILRSFQGALLVGSDPVNAAMNFETAAKCIGVGMLLDGLDGRIARMTNTTSDFGRELDSLADIISFGIAPALLAFAWGVQFVDLSAGPALVDHLRRAGVLIVFLFLLCGAARLARFNVQKNPIPKNPGRPDRKYFVGLPIPSAAAFVASVVFFFDSEPVRSWQFSVAWIATLAVLGFLMVSTWRYYSFKDINLRSPRSTLIVVIFGFLIILIWIYPQIVLMLLSFAYVMSGIVIRVLGILRRLRPSVRNRGGQIA